MSNTQVLVIAGLCAGSAVSLYLVFLRNISVRHEVFPSNYWQASGAALAHLFIYLSVFLPLNMVLAQYDAWSNLPKTLAALVSLSLVIFLSLKRSLHPLIKILGTRWIRIKILIWLALLAVSGRIIIQQIYYSLGLWTPFPLPVSFEWFVTPLGLLSALVIAPILEEILFRGLFIQGLRDKYPILPIILVTAFLFTLGHLPGAFFSTFFLGVLAAWAYIKTESIYAPIAVHFGYNLLSQTLRIPASGFLLGEADGPLAFNIYVLTIAGTVIMTSFFLRKSV